jgi:UDP-N-acetyl-2-amino-2-deoxyglucuronate dehydrogenase
VSRLRLGVVGIDHYHSTGWVESLEWFDDVIDIVALYDPDPEIGRTLAPRYHDPSLSPSLAPKYRERPFYTDLDKMLAEQHLDLALVTLVPRDAPAAIEKLAAAGVHMLVDKPVARNAADARRAFEAVRRAGVKATVGLGKRLAFGWLDGKRMIESGRLGRILSAESIFVTSSVAVRDPRNHLFSAERSGHGILHWLGVHDVDALVWMSGERIVEVQAMTANVGGNPIDVEDAISVAFRFSGGGLGTLHFVNAFPRPNSDGYMAFRGSEGSIKISSDGNLTFVGPGTRANPLRVEERRYEAMDPGGYGAGALLQIQDLLDAIREDRDPLVTGEDLVRALEVIDAAYESAATGRRVTVTAR